MKRHLFALLAVCSSLSVISFTPAQAGIENPSQLASKIVSSTTLSPQAVQMALAGYQWALQKGQVKRPNLLTIVDFSIPSNKNRLFVIDLNTGKPVKSLLVAHGSGTGSGTQATRFSNSGSSHTSSLGVYVTDSTYVGKHNLSLRVRGLERGFNDNAYARAVVVHGAGYVSQEGGRAGRSWGCFAVDTKQAPALINLIKNGTVIYAYAPSKNYLASTKILSGNHMMAA